MTPEAKGKELIDKFGEKAEMVVDEIINSHPLHPQRTPGPTGNPSARYYWQQVKEEMQHYNQQK